jgi:drug/metabolite transporter (DMT)-like permease
VVCAMTLAVLFILTRGKLALTKQTLSFSVFFWASGVCWLYGLTYISSAQSAILSFTMPLFAIPLSVYMLSERSSRIEAHGGMVGFAGVILFNIPLLKGEFDALGISLALCGAFFWAVFSVYMKRLSFQDPLVTLTTGFLVATPLWALLAIFDFRFQLSYNLAFDIGYLVLAASVLSLYLWGRLLKLERVTRLTVIIFVTPVITMAYDVITTGVVPNWLALAGVALIFIGIYTSNILAHRGEKTPAATSTTSAALNVPWQHD